MPKPSKYYDVVKRVYLEHPRARDNDAILVARSFAILVGDPQWKEMTLRDFLYCVYKHLLPAPDTITRAGRKVRQIEPSLGGSADSKRRRRLETAITLEDLDYNIRKAEDTGQMTLFGGGR